MQRALAGVIGILASTVLIGRAEAATVLAMTVEELAAGSDRVVRARVVSQRTEFDPGQGFVYRITTLEVLEDLRGEGPGEVVVRQLGGEAAGRGLLIDGDADLREGEEVVLFLSRGDPREPVMHLKGLSLGRFSIERRRDGPPMAVRGLEGLQLVRPGGGEVDVPVEFTLDELRDRIGAARLPPPAMPGGSVEEAR
jgi:hypothetical protein